MPFSLRSLVAALVALGFALVAWIGPGATAQEPAPVAIADAPPLTWGFKQSWRIYAGAPETSDGATLTGSGLYNLGWEFESGSFDATAGETVLRYKGTAHWRKYYAPDSGFSPPPGYTGPLDVHVLDVALSDPIVTIGRDSATISVVATSRDIDTWELVETGRVDVVNLAADGVTPTVGAGITTWSAIPATSTAGANAVFANNYQAGLAVDAVGFSYSGPGGAPDFTEQWDAPGSTKLSQTGNEILTTTGVDDGYDPWWIDRERRIVHYRTSALVEGQTIWTYRAFSLDAMAVVGEPLYLPHAERVSQVNFVDSNTGRLFYRRSGESATTRSIRYDAGQGKYVFGEAPSGIPIVGSTSLSWDHVGQRAFNIRRLVPAGVSSTAYDLHQWQINLYDEQPDGSWTVETRDLPNFPTGLNRRGYPEASGGLATPKAVAAPDGSLILLGTQRTSNDPSVPQPDTAPGALRVDLSGAQPTVTPVAGTDVGNDSATGQFDLLQPGPGGQVTLFRVGGAGVPNVVQTVTVPESGDAAAEPSVPMGDVDLGPIGDGMFAVDPTDGTVWIGGYQSQRIVGIADGRIVSDQYFAQRHPRGGPVIAGPGHVVYAQTNDGSPAEFGGSPIYGFGRFERLGWSPDVAADPAPQAVALGTDEESESVTLHSSGSGDPQPQRQWQVKAPGAPRFRDVEGETGEALTVAAERGMGGSEYRAVYSNPAGRIASAPAALSVDYAPEIAVDVVDVAAVEGDEATFQVLSQGAPEPEVQWQRRVAGFWQPIAADDENFAIGEGTLTVAETNLDQSGTRFRARVENTVDAIYSREAKLTVAPATTIPPGGLSLDGVSLDWSGSDELQRMAPNMQPNFLSAGVSDGGEPTYSAAAANARVLHVAGDGTETAASWATRSAQVGAAVDQLVRLTDGHAEIEQDGSATVIWPGAFTVNFYGGMVPFTLSRPELTVDADGAGTLRADLSGYGASMADPGDRHPVAPVEDVVVATFDDAEIDPAGVVTFESDYAGVETEAPTGFAAQDRVSAGWGAWPQPFVDFHAETGLAPYWYSSGGAFDAHKAASPFSVDFTGAGSVPPLDPGGDGDGDVLDPPPAPVVHASVTALAVERTSYGRSARATVRVAATGGGTPSGGVTVRVGGQAVDGTLAGGVAHLRLPATLRPGTRRVTADYAGAAGVAASSATATLRVDKAKPRVGFRVVRARDGRPSRLSVVARFPGAADLHPTGQVVVLDRRRIVRVVRLRAADEGRRTVVLPRLGPGAHFLRVALAAGPLQRAAASGYRAVRSGR
jgi:hypothetical protein